MKKFLQSLIERKRKELKDKEERMKNSQRGADGFGSSDVKH